MSRNFVMRTLCRPSWPTQTSLLSRLPPQALVPRRILRTSTTTPAPVDVPKLIQSPGSAHHNSLPSFLRYSDRMKLTPRTPVFIGTHYEYTVALSLLRLGFSLLRTGGRSDGGIDLMGHWVLPPLREPLPVIVQCKARGERCCDPSHIRELEGSFQGVPAGWRNKDVLGLLVTTQRASKGILETLAMSRWPMGFMKVSASGTVVQLLWNRVASERGLEGVGVTVRHTPRVLLPVLEQYQGEEGNDWTLSDGRTRNLRKTKKYKGDKFKDAGTKKDIQLTWMGTPIFADRTELVEETMGLVGDLAPEEEEPVSTATRRKAGKSVKSTTTQSPKTTNPRTKAKKPAAKPAKTTIEMAAITTTTTTVMKRLGRPPDSKAKPSPSQLEPASQPEPAPRPRGRPKGSKNKVKPG
ncbi:hypothetical protein BDV95DRAFT_65830 [Massariosphaeria phaeospora]|uniref:Restriction endonuclease type IV Mrr domain-containing protein n=1 Tax=Massariosphaeria phaeospora TaxID=100035 RepID=A0A7C8I4I9_9PLEO|nr:hypothetical protein BDV95DRAFT_65830 [Massariosphaeria phaeospora]